MIPLFSVSMSPVVGKEVEKVLMSGYIGEGEKVKQFEKELQDYIGNEYIVAVNSGTSALHLALRLANVSGGKVISTPMTCSATNFPILANNADIVWADVDPETGNISPDSIEECLYENSDVRAIMVVHWGGYPCDLDYINIMASNNGIPVIEDGAHAFGSEYRGMKVGNHSNFVMFSFQAIKHLTTVDGGALCFSRKEDYEKAKLLRWFGIDRENKGSGCDSLRCEEDIFDFGYKFHMNDVSATVGLCNMKIVEDVINKHRSHANFYDEVLSDFSGIKLLKRDRDRSSSFWLYTMRVERRDDFIQAMKDRGIMTSKVHARNDFYSCTVKYKRPLPNLDLFYSEMVSIPVGAHLEQHDLNCIVNSIQEGW